MNANPLKKLTCCAFLAFSAQAFFIPSHADQGPKAVDHAAIQATIDANNAAVGSKDMQAILATFSADAVMVGPDGMRAAGTEALRGAFGQFLGVSPQVTVHKSDVVQAGDTALYSYSWSISGKTPDGHPIQQSGLTTAVLRKQAGGRWLIVIDHPFTDQLMPKN